jgi:hypothetical protein
VKRLFIHAMRPVVEREMFMGVAIMAIGKEQKQGHAHVSFIVLAI